MNQKCFPLELFKNQKKAGSLICQINEGVLRNPLTNACGHSFCKCCLSTHLKISSKCKECGQLIKKSNLKFDTTLGQQLDSLLMGCPNWQKGCKWTGSYAQIDSHLAECQKSLELPGNSKQMSCVMCLRKFDLNQLEQHQKNCEFQKLPCENGCSQKIMRKNMDFHVQAACMLAVQSCSFAPYGCSFSARTEEVLKHCEDPASKIYHQRIKNEHKQKHNQQMLNLLGEIKSLLTSNAQTEASKNSGNSTQVHSEQVQKSIDTISKMVKKERPKTRSHGLSIQNEMILPKLNINKTKSSKKIKFSNFNKGDNIKIINNGVSVRGTKGAYQVAQLSVTALPYQHFTFTIDFIGSPIGIGLADNSKLLGNNFNMRYQTVNHGCFMLISDGSHLVDNRGGFFWPGSTMSFSQGDIIDMVYEYDRGRVIFSKLGSRGGTAVYLPQIIDSDNLRPTVYVYDQSSQVTFLESPRQ